MFVITSQQKLMMIEDDQIYGKWVNLGAAGSGDFYVALWNESAPFLSGLLELLHNPKLIIFLAT